MALCFTALEALELRVRPSQHIVGPPWAEHNGMVEVISSEQMLYMGDPAACQPTRLITMRQEASIANVIYGSFRLLAKLQV